MQQFPNTAFEIAPTGDYFGDQYYRELTEKYTGKARVENGSVSFEGAGVPFPLASLTRDNPQAGVQTAYNMYLRKRGSNHGNIVYHEGWMMFMSENASRTSPDGLPADTFSETVPIERMLGIRFQETQYSFIPAASQTGYRLDLPDA